MRKAVITILGLAGGKVEQNDDAVKYVNFQTKAKYKFHFKEAAYTNTLPLWIDKYKEHNIIPVYTDIAKNLQIKLCKENENKDISNLFNSAYHIVNENDYNEVFRVLNKAIRNFDECIVDLTHGFRHIPILATISLIVANIKDATKIKHIWFAKELVKPEIGVQGKYEIIDLKEYLELANLSFIITNFQDNYTISKHIEVKSEKYNQLIKNMNKFSSDIMSLSLENLLDNSARKLKETIDKIREEDDTLLKEELEMLSSHLSENFVKKTHKYETYFHMAKVLNEKGYLVHSLALVFEAIGFYLKSSFGQFDDSLKRYIEEKEKKIETDRNLDYYKLTEGCRSFLFFDKSKNTNTFFTNEQMEIIYKEINSTKESDKFKKFAARVKKLRNNLLHANSGNKLSNTQNYIEAILKDFEDFCMKNNIFNVNNKSCVQTSVSRIKGKNPIEAEVDEKLMPNGEKRVVKTLRRKIKKIQTAEEKRALLELDSKLSEKFNSR